MSVCTGHVVSAVCYVCGWCSNIAIIVRTVRTGHVVSVVCSVYGCWDLI